VKLEASRLKRNVLLHAAAISPFAVGMLSFYADQGRSSSVLPILLGCVLTPIGLVTGAYAIAANPSPVGQRGTIEVDDACIRCDGKVLALRRHITGGFILPTEETAVVRLRRTALPDVLIRCDNEADAHALLCALGLDPSSTVTSLWLGSRVRAHGAIAWTVAVGVFLMLFAPSVIYGALGFSHPSVIAFFRMVACFAVLAYFALRLVPSRIAVGADGLFIRWLGMRRFIPFSDVTGFVPGRSFGARTSVVVKRKSARDYVLPMPTRLVVELAERDYDLIERKLHDAHAEFVRTRGVGDVILPERAGRSLPAWVRALRASGAGAAADHRTAPIASEALFSVVRDAEATAMRRAQAAIALGARGEGERKRLRIVAESTAAPEVRSLLELVAAEAEEEALAAELERTEARAGRR
jgi:hypothetical protein